LYPRVSLSDKKTSFLCCSTLAIMFFCSRYKGKDWTLPHWSPPSKRKPLAVHKLWSRRATQARAKRKRKKHEQEHMPVYNMPLQSTYSMLSQGNAKVRRCGTGGTSQEAKRDRERA
jgi:hypothetical protein